jgi:ABC-type cobalt transport system substrate-binding protein
MLKKLKNKKAQAVMGEYALIFIIAVAMTVSMLVFFRRAIQAKVFDARNAMVGTVMERTQGYYNGSFHGAYEPYYTNVESIVARSLTEKRTLLEGGSTGIFRKITDRETSAQTKSRTAPPKDTK